MKKQFISLIFTVLLISSLPSCKKDNIPVDPSIEKKALLTSGPWKISKVEQMPASTSPWEDITAGVPPCEKDNLFVYMANLGYLETEGASKCDPMNPDIITTGTWYFDTFWGYLQIRANGSTVVYNVDTLNSSSLVVRYITASQIQFRLTMTY